MLDILTLIAALLASWLDLQPCRAAIDPAPARFVAEGPAPAGYRICCGRIVPDGQPCPVCGGKPPKVGGVRR